MEWNDNALDSHKMYLCVCVAHLRDWTVVDCSKASDSFSATALHVSLETIL